MSARIRVKICGLTEREGMLAAVRAGTDAVGFIFARRSPRRVEPEAAAELSALLPPFVSRIGVFVAAGREELETTAASCGLDAIQLHGEQSPAFCQRLRESGPFRSRTKIIKAFRIRGEESVREMCSYRGKVDAFLLDTYRKGQAGGTGATFNWELALRARELGLAPLILAGGLGPENIGRAVTRVRPWAVDVNSGVESAPGRKDPGKIAALFSALLQV